MNHDLLNYFYLLNYLLFFSSPIDLWKDTYNAFFPPDVREIIFNCFNKRIEAFVFEIALKRILVLHN